MGRGDYAEPRLVLPNTRQVPSASFTNAGPPESPKQVPRLHGLPFGFLTLYSR